MQSERAKVIWKEAGPFTAGRPSLRLRCLKGAHPNSPFLLSLADGEEKEVQDRPCSLVFVGRTWEPTYSWVFGRSRLHGHHQSRLLLIVRAQPGQSHDSLLLPPAHTPGSRVAGPAAHRTEC